MNPEGFPVSPPLTKGSVVSPVIKKMIKIMIIAK